MEMVMSNQAVAVLTPRGRLLAPNRARFAPPPIVGSGYEVRLTLFSQFQTGTTTGYRRQLLKG